MLKCNLCPCVSKTLSKKVTLLRMPNTTSWEGGGASVTHPEEISTCVAVLLSLTLKMSDDQLCLNINVSSTPSLRRKPLTTQQRWARKKQNAGKRKMNSSSQPEERRVKQRRVEEEQDDEEEDDEEQPPPPAERADRKAPQKKKDGGGVVWQPPPPAERADRRAPQKKKDGGVKTSSLFKHNPDIPALLSPVVSQVKEKIFTSDSFSDMDLHPHLVATLNKVLNVSTVTSVQKQTMPALLSGRDAVVRSQTGSGKTLAYAVPVVQSLQALQQKVSRSDGPLAVIIVPTRELAQQTFLTFQKLLKPFTWIVPGVLMGGEKRKSEKARLRKGINILVSTPGRLVDHIKNTLVIAFSSVRWLILDEADRILDLGFEKDLTVILNSLNTTGPSRQNVLLSATLSQGVTRLADVCLNDPVTINVSGPASSDLTVPAKDPGSADQSESFTLPEALQQFVVVVPSKVRLVCLAAFILHKCKFSKNNKLIVFTSSCEAVEFLHAIFTAVLSTNQKPPLSFLRLHGNMKQEDRTEVFKEFSVSQSGVLLCTDVAARGLHLPAVTWIIQFTPPTAAAEYVHRVGRTARIGGRGSSLLFLTPAETAFTTELANHNISLSEMKLEDILSSLMMDDTFKGRGRYHSQSSSKALEQETRERATVLQTEFENFVHSDAQSLQNAKKALQSFLRSYTAFPAPLKHIFHIKHLHLGHTAKSFGLRDAPQGLSAPGGAKSKKKSNQKRGGGKGKSSANREESLLRSEFSDGREGGKERKRRNKKKTGGEEEE